MPYMNMKFLRSFLAFVDYRNATQAAASLNIARHNIGSHVGFVEKLVGKQLLEARASRPVPAGEAVRTQLTEAGVAFYSKALTAMQAHDAMFGAAERIPADSHIIRLTAVAGLLELALDTARNNLSDTDQKLLNALLFESELETTGVPTSRLHRSDGAPG